jgi:hypothetical protein
MSGSSGRSRVNISLGCDGGGSDLAVAVAGLLVSLQLPAAVGHQTLQILQQQLLAQLGYAGL